MDDVAIHSPSVGLKELVQVLLSIDVAEFKDTQCIVWVMKRTISDAVHGLDAGRCDDGSTVSSRSCLDIYVRSENHTALRLIHMPGFCLILARMSAGIGF